MAHRRRGVGVGRTSAAAASSSSSNGSSAHASISNGSSSTTTARTTNTTTTTTTTTSSSLVQRKADEIKAMSLQNAITTLELLEVKLTEFARTHQNEIKNDPIFRHRFLQMCAPLGIDVLASSKQPTNLFHSLFFGGANSDHNKNEFYYELAVKCAEVCLATQNRNGGIMSLQEIQSILQHRKTKMRVASAAVVVLTTTNSNNNKKNNNKTLSPPPPTLDDIRIAIEQLRVLGGGFRTVQLPASTSSTEDATSTSTTTTMVISVPTELDHDHMQLLSIAQQQQEIHEGSCGLTIEQLQRQTQWNSPARVQRAMDLLLQEGMAWIDVYHGDTYYWFTSIWQQQLNIGS